MSGALGSVFGGGNILGLVMNVASMVFPPLAIANSLANMVTGAIGQAFGQFVDTLVKEFGMPKFLGDAVKQMADNVLGQQMKPSSPAVDAATAEQFGGQVEDLTKQIYDTLLESAKKTMDLDKGDGKSAKSNNKSTASTSATSWLEAIAMSMGEAAGNKAAKMVELASQLKELSSAGGSEEDQQQAAKEMSVVNAQFQATSQEYNMLQTAFSTAIKAIGEGMSAMARKQ